MKYFEWKTRGKIFCQTTKSERSQLNFRVKVKVGQHVQILCSPATLHWSQTSSTLKTQPVTNNITFNFTIFEHKSPESTFPPQLSRRSDQEWNTIQGLRSPVTMIMMKMFLELFRKMKMKWRTSFYPSYIYFKPLTRSSWLNCGLRVDEAVYWVSIGHYEVVAVGDWWY